jgi:hypothetical protein
MHIYAAGVLFRRAVLVEIETSVDQYCLDHRDTHSGEMLHALSSARKEDIIIRCMLRAYSFGKLFLLRFKQMLTNIAKAIVTLIPVKCCMHYYQQEKRKHHTMHAACVLFRPTVLVEIETSVEQYCLDHRDTHTCEMLHALSSARKEDILLSYDACSCVFFRQTVLVEIQTNVDQYCWDHRDTHSGEMLHALLSASKEETSYDACCVRIISANCSC